MNWQVDEYEFENHNNDNTCNTDCKCYHKQTIKHVQAVYLIGLFLWFLGVLLLDIYEEDLFIWLFIFLPPIVFLINFINLENCSKELEKQMFKGNFLSFGFLITIILINWNSPLENQDKSKFFQLLVVAFILIMISLVDIWVGGEFQSIIKHIKTVLHTCALSLLATALYLYYQYYQRSCINC